MIRISAGTAKLLGKSSSRVEVLPTTAYLMIGSNCIYDCNFCPQARGSLSSAGLLSRITWPKYPVRDILPRIKQAYQENALSRVCLQTVHSKNYHNEILETIRKIKGETSVPICVSAYIRNKEEAGSIFKCGADRLSIAVDATRKDIFEKLKNRSWERIWEVLSSSAIEYPGRVGTHIIAGLGETEKDLCRIFQKCKDLNINTALFAFTPVKGTKMEKQIPPDINSYRRMQTALYLINQKEVHEASFTYEYTGKITSFGMNEPRLKHILSTGKPFQTSGCPGCNRPNYNERPGEEPYNYPRDLNDYEIKMALNRLGWSEINDDRSSFK